jgi:inner membrane protein
MPVQQLAPRRPLARRGAAGSVSGMDSVSQFVLGAAWAAAVLGTATRPARALLWGGFAGTLPDLDVLFDHGDAIANMVRHRAESHALLYLTLLAPLLGGVAARLHRDGTRWRRWTVALWLALVTHPLLDAMTIYGTRLWLPWREQPVAIGSLFVVDPLYTLPLLVGCLVALVARDPARRWRWNLAGLVLSTAYAGWSLVAQQLATAPLRAALQAQGIREARLVVTPAPLQTLLWRCLALTETTAYEGFWSPFDQGRPLALVAIDRGAALLAAVRAMPAPSQLLAFSGDACKAAWRDDTVVLTDLRMGQEPHYVFQFPVARRHEDGTLLPIEPTVRTGSRIDVGRGLAWLWPRLWGGDLPPPR